MRQAAYLAHSFAGLDALYRQFVNSVVAWLTPGRLRIYPVALLSCVVASSTWASLSAVASGVPYLLTVGQDFKSFYTGGRFLIEGRAAELYDFDAQKDFQAGLAIRGNKLLPFLHPPFAAVLWAPFALANYVMGLLAWWTVGVAALAASLSLLRKEVLSSAAPSTARLLVLSFLFYPVLAWYLYAQTTAVTLLLYTLGFVWLRRGRDLEAGVALGLLLYKPQLAAIPWVMLIVKGRWRALLGGAAAAGMWLILGFTISPAAMGEYARIGPVWLNLLLRSAEAKIWAIHTFYGFAILLLDGVWPRGAEILGTLLSASALGLIAVWWRRTAWQPGTRTWDLMFAATLAMGMLISPYLFFYDSMLLLVPLAILWGQYSQVSGSRLLDGGPLLAWTALLYVAPFSGNLLAAGQLWMSAALELPRAAVQIAVPVIAGWAWVVARSAQSPTRPNASLTRPTVPVCLT